MTPNKKLLLNFLWFLLGMTAIAAVPLLLIEQCSQPRTSGLRESDLQRVALDDSRVRQTICAALKYTCRLHDTNQSVQSKER